MFGTGTRRVAIGLTVLVCVVGLAACGSDSDSDGASGATSSSNPDPQAAGSGVTVTIGSTDLGDVMVDGEGHTLYVFTPDGTGEPTCTDSCAATWPPLISKGEPSIEGIEDGVISTVETADGSTQVTAAGQPLYIYAADAAPGDADGQGSGGKWYVVAKDGSLIKDEAGTKDTSGGSGY